MFNCVTLFQLHALRLDLQKTILMKKFGLVRLLVTDKYLKSSKYIDWENRSILEKAIELSVGLESDIAKIECLFFIRERWY